MKVGACLETNYNQIFKLASLAGRMLLESNAEEYRVEDTTLRILQTSGLNQAGSFSNTTGLFLSLADTEHTEYNYFDVVRVRYRENNIEKIEAVNRISRQFSSGEMSAREAYLALKTFDKRVDDKMMVYTNILLVLSFVILFGGGLKDLMCALCLGVFAVVLNRFRQRIYFTDILYNILQISLSTILFSVLRRYVWSDLNPIIVLSALIMPTYPSTFLTNAMRDILRANNLAGVIKVIEASMTIVSIILGFVIGMTLSKWLIF